MHDQIAMCVRDRFAYLQEQMQALFDARARAVAPVVDAFAVNEFEHEITLTLGRFADIEQARDMRMLQACKQFAFARKALLRGAIERGEAQHLEGRTSSVFTIAACDQPHLAHATHAKQTLNAPRPDELSLTIA